MEVLFGMIMIFGLVFFYFLPGLVASWRDAKNKNGIAVLNLILGWTFLGWAIAMVWAFCAEKENKKLEYFGKSTGWDS